MMLSLKTIDVDGTWRILIIIGIRYSKYDNTAGKLLAIYLKIL